MVASIAFSVYRALTSVAMIIMSSSTPATGNVHELISSLSSTGRRHVCAKDLLTFSCEISGLYLSWVVDGAHRTILFGDQRVDTIQTVSQGKAILTMNEEIEGDTESRRRLRSALLIDSSQYYIGYHNLSCSSDRDTQNLTFREGEIPTMPNNLTVNYFLTVQSASSQAVISLMWSAPENLERFDLEYYIVQILVSEPGRSYELNGTTTELEYIFNLDVPPMSIRNIHEIITIMISAVTKCGTRSPVYRTFLPEMDFGEEDQFQSSAINVIGGYLIQSLFASMAMIFAVDVKRVDFVLTSGDNCKL